MVGNEWFKLVVSYGTEIGVTKKYHFTAVMMFANGVQGLYSSRDFA
jgi:hypothetical protein